MKKVLVVLILVLMVLLAEQFESLRTLSDLREWRGKYPSSDIVIGVSWPFADNQDGVAEGLNLAADELNAHPILGKRIRFAMRDSRFDQNKSTAIAMEFVRSPMVTAVIGYYDDRLAVRASAVYEQSKLLHVVVGANNTYMTAHGFRYLIRSALSNYFIGRQLARMFVERGFRKVAVVAEEGVFGEDLAFEFGNALDSLGGRVVYQRSFVPGLSDFRETSNELEDAGADAVFFAGYERDGATFIKRLRGRRSLTPIVGSFSDTPLMHVIAGAALDGVMFYDIYDSNAPTPQNRDFVKKYRARYGAEPSSYAAQAYDAVRIIANAITATGSTNSLDLSYAIRQAPAWEGANGRYKFDAHGEMAEKPIYLEQFRKPVASRP